MTSLYLNCGSGISGDMFVGALLDLGVPWTYLVSELSSLDLDFKVRRENVARGGVPSTRFCVEYVEQVRHRSLQDILDLLDRCRLSVNVKKSCSRVFTELALSESIAHNCSIEEVCFHEIGAIDSIVDVLSASILLDRLGVAGFYCSPLSVGCGWMNLQGHGVVSLPAPAVRILLEGLPVERRNIPYELTTPTGAALVKAFCRGFQSPPKEAIRLGLGAGSRDLEEPNVLKAELS